MNREEAKFILQAYRPGTSDADDPQFAEALAMLEQDPELAKWYEQEQQLDEIIRAKLTQVEVPKRLRSEILAGERVTSFNRLRPRRAVLAWAAGILLLLSGTLGWWLSDSGGVSSTAWKDGMIETLSAGFSLDYRTESDTGTETIQEVEDWLEANAVASDSALPASLENAQGLGCKRWNWRGRPVALVCFLVGEDRVVHLFMTESKHLVDRRLGESPVIASDAGWTTARWRKGQTVYLAASKADRSIMERFLQPRAGI